MLNVYWEEADNLDMNATVKEFILFGEREMSKCIYPSIGRAV